MASARYPTESAGETVLRANAGDRNKLQEMYENAWAMRGGMLLPKGDITKNTMPRAVEILIQLFTELNAIFA